MESSHKTPLSQPPPSDDQLGNEVSLGANTDCDSPSQSTSTLSGACFSFIYFPFSLFFRTLTETAALLQRRYHSKTHLLTKRDYGLGVLFLVMYTIVSAAQFFGQNFWLASFSLKNAKPTFVTLVIPSLVWAFLNLIVLLLYKLILRPSISLTFWRRSKFGIMLLVVIGISDAFAGLTSVYSVPHIPALLQTACYASGTIVVYIVHRIAYPETSIPLSFMLCLSFLFLMVGVAFAVIPMVLEGTTSLHAHPAWAGVFFLSILLPAIYNVFQGRFLGIFSDRRRSNGDRPSKSNGDPERQALLSNTSASSLLTIARKEPSSSNVLSTEPRVPHEACMLVVLTGDYWVQALVTALLFLPMDALPWFGASDTVAEAWEGFTVACQCIWFECSDDYNFPYMILYTLGFWATRALLTFLNVYSPTAAALVAQATIPVVNLMLVICPTWNVFGTTVNVWYTIGCFLASLASTIIFFAVNESHLQRADEAKSKAADEAENQLNISQTVHAIDVDEHDAILNGQHEEVDKLEQQCIINASVNVQ